MKSLTSAALVSLILAPASAAQTPKTKSDPQRFANVKSWNGTFTLQRQGTGAKSDSNAVGAHYRGTVSWSVSGVFQLADRQDKPNQPLRWSGDGQAHASIEFDHVYGNESFWARHTSCGSGAVALRPQKLPTQAARDWAGVGPKLSIQRYATEGRYDLTLGAMVVDFDEHSTSINFNRGVATDRVVRNRAQPGTLIVALEFLPLPAQGLVLKGTKEIESYTTNSPDTCTLIRNLEGTDGAFWFGHHHLSRPNDTPRVTISWELTPAAEDVRLVIEPESQAQYAAWVPRAGADEKTPGNDVAFIAKLETRDGKPATVPARKIRFELVDVSREPGLAINYPPRPRASDDFDLRIHQDKNAGRLNVQGARGQLAETLPSDAGVLQAKVVVSAHDFGAYGLLRAVADMPDGTQAISYVRGQPNRRAVLLPKRNDNSRIAEALRSKLANPKLKDDDDSETDPEGDPTSKGDGLTLYEEYRGFFVNGQHTRGKPVKKELFIWDKVRNDHAAPGIQHFADVTGLVIHRIKNDDEVRQDYVINFNHTPSTPRKTDQHAVKFGEGGIKASKSFAYIVETIPASPKSVRLVLLAPIFQPGSEGFKLMTAHELGHALNIPHHGHADLGWVNWRTAKDKDGNRILTETVIGQDETAKPKGKAVTVVVKNEDGTPFVPDKSFDEGRKLWVAKQHGQHSGDPNCFMRYIVAKAYVPADNESQRCWITPAEVRGSGLCKGNTATGAPARRYGDAHAGDCIHRFRISDAP